jgi:signal transduction histidine kinase
MDFMISSSSVFDSLTHLSEASKVKQITKNFPYSDLSAVYRYYQPVSSKAGVGLIHYDANGSFDYGISSDPPFQDTCFLFSLIHPDDLSSFQASIDLYASVGDHWHHQWRILTPKGEVRWLDGNATVVEVRSDATRVWDGVLVDITDRKLLTHQRERLLELERTIQVQAERTARSKDEFLTVVSHELKTPLTSVMAWLNLLRSGAVDPQTLDRGLVAIQNGVETHIGLIEQLLDASRIVCDKININLSRFDFSVLAIDAVEAARAALPPSSYRQDFISLTLVPGDFICLGDFFRLNQVVSQLLSNACKFTPSSGHINVSLYNKDGFIFLNVSDTGSGISPDFLPNCFGFFSHEDSVDTRSTSGLGLGLAIVRHLVELHGGVVSVTSPGRGKGSTFTIKLPSASVNSF